MYFAPQYNVLLYKIFMRHKNIISIHIFRWSVKSTLFCGFASIIITTVHVSLVIYQKLKHVEWVDSAVQVIFS